MISLRNRARKRRAHKDHTLRLEFLEPRMMLSTAPPLLDPLTVPKFVNPLPNPLSDAMVYKPTTATVASVPHYDVGMYQVQQDLGLGLKDAAGKAKLTTVWGYGQSRETASYPGKSFVVQSNKPIEVHWSNNLVDNYGKPLPHFLPIDTTVHWADPLKMGHTMSDMPNNRYTGPVPVVPHLHGGHTESDSDGLPEAWFTPNLQYTGMHFKKDLYYYENTQEAATLWYHDHALGITRLNVYAGLAGFYIVRDGWDTGQPNNPAKLPSGPYEVPIVIQDRMFTADGQLYYPSQPLTSSAPDPSVHPHFYGDVILANGKAWPTLEVEPRRYRLRLLNGSDSRFYSLWLASGTSSGPAIRQVGSDTGLLNKPLTLTRLKLAPGERADVVVDFSAFSGKTILVRNDSSGCGSGGGGCGCDDGMADSTTTGQIMAFRVTKRLDRSYPNPALPTALRPTPIAPLKQSGATRQLALFNTMDEYGRMKPMQGTVAGGPMSWHAPVTEAPRLGDVEVWEVYNNTMMVHPVHLHLVSFQVLSRQKFSCTQDPATGGLKDITPMGSPRPPAANEAGWKDTIAVMPHEVVRVIARFDMPGMYVWHCHILSHEDHEMMRPFHVGGMHSMTTAASQQSSTPGTTQAARGVLTEGVSSAGESQSTSPVLASPEAVSSAYPLSDPRPFGKFQKRRLERAVDAVFTCGLNLTPDLWIAEQKPPSN